MTGSDKTAQLACDCRIGKLSGEVWGRGTYYVRCIKRGFIQKGANVHTSSNKR